MKDLLERQSVGEKKASTRKPELNHSLPFKIYLDSASKDVDRLVVFLASEIRKLTASQREVTATRRILKALLLNLVAHAKADPELYTGISFNVGSYKSSSRYNPLRISKHIITVTKALITLGYLECHKGFNDRFNPDRNRQTRIRPKKKLIKLLQQYLGKFETVKVVESTDRETLVLRARNPITKKKPKVEYKDNECPESVGLMRNNLFKINKALSDATIALSESVDSAQALKEAKNDSRFPDLSANTLHRVFNNGAWDQGGRFYGAWWIGAPKELRRHILIGSPEGLKPTIEIDYSGIHIDLLYAMEGIDFHKDIAGDPYQLLGIEMGKELRGFCKVSLNIVLNSESKKSAIQAIQEKLSDKPILKQKVVELGGVAKLTELFELQHQPISKYFYSGAGLKLQYSDSQIAESVLMGAIDKGFVVLPVHDSFICDYTKADKLYDLMIKAYQAHVLTLCPEGKFRETPYPRVKLVKSRYSIILDQHIKDQEKVNIETEEYEQFIEELKQDA